MTIHSAVAATMPEKVLQEHVRVTCRNAGLLHYHPHRSERSAPGWPDSVILSRYNVTGRTLYLLELKRQDPVKGKASDEQRRWLRALSEVDRVEVGLVRPADWEVVREAILAGAPLPEGVRW